MISLIVHVALFVATVGVSFVAGWFIGGNHVASVAAAKAKIAADTAAAQTVVADVKKAV